jgi:hypothetical protein
MGPRRQTEQLLQDLRRRRTALDCVAAGTLVMAAVAWALSPEPAPVDRCGGPARVESRVEPVVVEPVFERVVVGDQIVTTVELVEEPEP